jgi:sugar transferase (PEP-CTERM/EpsH1 system associated)
MKILWVKAGGLAPLDTGGKIRSFHILKELAHQHEVTVFTFYRELANDPHPALHSLFHSVETVPLKLPPAKSFEEGLWYARHLFSHLPHSIAKFCRPQVRRQLRSLVEREPPNVIVCDFIMPAPVIPWAFPCPKVVFTHNVEAQIWQRHYLTTRNPVWKAVTWREYRAMERAERHYLKLADHVLTVSEPDRNFFARLIDSAKITVIPTGVDTDYFHPDGGEEIPDRMVFTGSMDWMPNDDGMVYFLQEILPLIRQRSPQATLAVVGRKPGARLQALAASIPGVEVTGRVEDIRPYVKQAGVYIVPLRIGGGTRLKIFEAMALGKPVVSTTIGAEGLPVENRKNILLADDPQNFANAVVALIQSPALRLQLGQAARELVESGYSWPAIGERFATVLESVVRDSPASEKPEPAAMAPSHATKR